MGCMMADSALLQTICSCCINSTNAKSACTEFLKNWGLSKLDQWWNKVVVWDTQNNLFTKKTTHSHWVVLCNSDVWMEVNDGVQLSELIPNTSCSKPKACDWPVRNIQHCKPQPIRFWANGKHYRPKASLAPETMEARLNISEFLGSLTYEL